MTPEVIHYEDEKLIGLVLDYEQAGQLLRILGATVVVKGGITDLWTKLVILPELNAVRETYEKLETAIKLKKVV